jgi:hypothetical protein
MLVLQAPSTSTRGLIFGVMVLAQAAVFRISIALPHAEQLRNVNGGRNYYSQFSNSLRSGPGYFPVGVENLVSQGDVNRDKVPNRNLYVFLNTNSDASVVQRNGMGAPASTVNPKNGKSS